MKKLGILAALLCITLVGFAQDQFKIDLDKSLVEWTGKKVTGSHNGTLDFSMGNLSFEDGKLIDGAFKVDMTSLTVTDIEGGMADKLKGHLMSDDFFGTETYNTAFLDFVEVSHADNGQIVVLGDLTIKDITHPVKFEAKITDGVFNANLSIDRTLYDIKYGSGSFFDNLGDKAIDDMFELSVAVSYN